MTIDPLTTSEYIEELKSRGFAGFGDTALLRYLRWGFDRIVRVTDWAWQQVDTIASRTSADGWLIGNTDMLSNQVPVNQSYWTNFAHIRISTPGYERLLRPTSKEDFYAQYPGGTVTLSSAPKGVPTGYYYDGVKIWSLPPADRPIDFVITTWQYRGLPADDNTAPAFYPLFPPKWEEMLLTAAECICHRRARQYEFARDCEDQLAEMMAEMLVEQNMKNPDLQDRVDAPWSRVR